MGQTNDKGRLVSLCLIARNEEDALPHILDDFSKQNYPHDQVEILLIDSGSTDKSRSIMDHFRNQNTSFRSVRVLDNPRITQAAGWNVAIKESTGDVIFRIDAHAQIPVDFISKNMVWIEQGEYVVGGRRPCTIINPTPWQETLLAAENSVFGSSMAPYRRGTDQPTYVKSVFHGAYRREVFDKAGGFDEDLGRTEDNEMHFRIRQHGYKIRFDPEIISHQFARLTLRKTIRQKFGNGLWVGRTLTYCAGCLSWYHFVPSIFVIFLMLAIILTLTGVSYLPLVMIAISYFLIASIAIVVTLKKRGTVYWTDALLLPILLIIHISYGIGTLRGLFSPIKRYKKN